MTIYDVQLNTETVHSMDNPTGGYVVAQQCYVNAGPHTMQQTSFVAIWWHSSAMLMQDCTLYSRHCHL